jgi:aldehyde dehydrogenase (NAD+)
MSKTVEDLEELRERLDVQRAFFASGATLDVGFRIQSLRRLRNTLKQHEDEIFQALHDDLGKSNLEAYITELYIVYDEINHCIKKVRSWAKPRRVRTALAHAPSSSRVYTQPFGLVAVFSPWNYPVQLALVPLVDAVCAGNCVALKTSRSAPATNRILATILDKAFDPAHVELFAGSAALNDWLLECRFDKILFTGSTRVGRTILKAAAKHLTPVALELGGKSPAIVDATANLDITAARIMYGKCINAGQTCVAPDYLLVDETVAGLLIPKLKAAVTGYFGEDPLVCADFPHIVSQHHYERLCGLIDNRDATTTIAFGGQRDAATRRIAPTVLQGVTLDDPVMGEEIFGPVLPVLTYHTLEDAYAVIARFEHPLALYIFSESRAAQEAIINRVPYGGGCVNDTLIHCINPNMGFGGFGASGMGSYHGKHGFDTFTHHKGILKKGTWLELPARTPPYTAQKLKLIKRVVG